MTGSFSGEKIKTGYRCLSVLRLHDKSIELTNGLRLQTYMKSREDFIVGILLEDLEGKKEAYNALNEKFFFYFNEHTLIVHFIFENEDEAAIFELF